MTEQVSGSPFVESRVFTVTFVFNLIGAFFFALLSYLPILLRLYGLPFDTLAIFLRFFSAFSYVTDQILFLVVLYFTCRGRLFDNIASTLISLILGSLIGFWLGGLIGFPIFASLYGTPLADLPLVALGSLQNLLVVPLGVMLTGFGLLAFYEYNQRWRMALNASVAPVARPLGVTALGILYIIVGFIDAVFLPAMLIYSVLVSLFFNQFLVFLTLAVFFAISVIGQIIIGIGLLRGRKWGWIPAFISEATSLLVALTAFVVALISPANFSGLLGSLLIVGFLLAFIFSLIIVWYLLSFNVRRCFGMINPPSPSLQPVEGTQREVS